VKIAATPARTDRRHLHSEEYEEYLKSERWRAVRAGALERAGHRCQSPGCRATTGLEVHHRHYGSLGAEAWADLVVLCGPCHRAADRRRAETIRLSRRLRAVRDAERAGR